MGFREQEPYRSSRGHGNPETCNILLESNEDTKTVSFSLDPFNSQGFLELPPGEADRLRPVAGTTGSRFGPLARPAEVRGIVTDKVGALERLCDDVGVEATSSQRLGDPARGGGPVPFRSLP